ncbi:unnamed protein product [Triticum turgidum subsp. durum]|uniref:non-specific serine/threonine protein kinase n=1 Tax=Triticum turgidum subsp. durum TaxID=4567 RepID=A0A9R1RVB7_TRITD|nr:unnamed protein product [Triticum turgidum subsp. durum]
MRNLFIASLCVEDASSPAPRMSGFSTATICALLLIFFHLPAPAVSLSFNYSTLSSADQNDIKIEGDASFSVGWIDISANRFGNIDYSNGRASYNARPMLLWDKATGKVASFTTRFSFAISGDINSKGQGMAFFLAAYPSSLPARCIDYNLALTNQSADAVATGDSRFVAVEFDTYNNTVVSDPRETYDHIGIDVNSLRSVSTLTLPSFELTDNLTAMVEYDNVSSILAVTVWVGDDRSGQARDRNYSLSSKVDLKSALPEQVSVGFSASTSNAIELHQLRSWSFSSSLEPPPQSPPPVATSSPSRPGPGVIAGAAAGATLFLVLLFAATAALVVRRRRRRRKIMETEEYYTDSEGEGDPMTEIEMGTGPRRFPYQELVEATRNFAAEEKLGQGGFGAVYRGYLREPPGLAVAIKRFSKHESSLQGKREYKSEIKVISRLRHRNLVQLLGWCHGREELLLVYELMPNRSLDIHLHGKHGTFLTWPMRMKILLELGSALLYLHEEWEQCVLHRDIKPSNVMLDESFRAKLGDFGLARLVDHAAGTQTMTAVSGTPGYLDPQCIVTGRASTESDVYSFGVVLLEVACGRKPMSMIPSDEDQQRKNGGVFRLVEWAWGLYGEGAILEAADERLNGDHDAAEVERVMVVGLWCTHPDTTARPTVREAMATLHNCSQLPVLPSKMPVPTYAPPPLTLGDEVGLSTSLTSSSSSVPPPTSGATTTISSDASTSTASSNKASSSLLKHQYQC